jgi:hypothetical protein
MSAIPGNRRGVADPEKALELLRQVDEIVMSLKPFAQVICHVGLSPVEVSNDEVYWLGDQLIKTASAIVQAHKELWMLCGGVGEFDPPKEPR